MPYERTIEARALPANAVVAGGCLFLGAALVFAANYTSPLVGFAAVCGIFVGVALFWSPWLAFLLAAAVIPLERIGRLTSDSSMYTMSIMRIVGLVALASFLFHALLKKWKVKFGLALLLYTVFCVWGLCTVALTSDFLGGVRAASAVLGNLLFFFLVVNAVRDWKKAKVAVAVWLTSCTLIGAYTIYEWHSGKSRIDETEVGETSTRFSTVLRDTSEWDTLGESVDRALGTTSSPAVHAINMILTIPFFFFAVRVERKWYVRFLAVAGGLIALYNVFLTNTRAAVIVAGATVFMCVLWKMVRITPLVLAGIAVCMVLAVALSPGAVFERVFKLSNYTYRGSGTLQTRLEYWKAGLQIIEKDWMTGVGLGNQVTVPALANVEGPSESTVHNEYLEMFIETGLLGWTLFWGFVALLLVCGLRAARVFKRTPQLREQYWFAVACVVAMIATMLYAVQVDVFHFPLKGWWLIAGLTWALYAASGNVGSVSPRESVAE